MRRTRLNRRDFLRAAVWAGAGPLLLPGRSWSLPERNRALPRVVHVHNGMAARWPKTTGMYRDYVDQQTVFVMLDEAVRLLKGSSLDDAWKQVFPLADPETRHLMIKINCNNSTDPVDGAGNIIDAIPEPAVAVIRGFVRAGGLSANCHIYDMTTGSGARYIPPWFRDKVRAYYPDVQFNASGSAQAGNDAWDPYTYVTWDPAYVDPPPDTEINSLVLDADYIVDIPIVKRHSQANATLGYKNHLGSIRNANALHPWLYNDTPEASVLADIMGSPVVPSDPSVKSIGQKTALVVGDMLFGQPCSNFGHEPRPWQIYGNEWPCSLIVGDDTVATDSVMIDILQSEPAYDGGCGALRSWSRRYLVHAEAKGQGVHESVVLPTGQRFDPALMTYERIDYRHIEMWPSGADLRCSRLETGDVLLEWEHYFPGNCEIHRATLPDFSDAEVVGASPTGQYIDAKPGDQAFYRVIYADTGP